MDLSVQLLLFIISIATPFTDIQTQTTSKWSWFDAQEHCRDKGGLPTENNISGLSYWTEEYVRLSPWIKIIGCYPNSVISKQNNTILKIMKRKSVGICQEICNQENTTRFAVQLNNCTCFKDELQLPNKFEDLSTNCNQSCHTMNSIYATECGSAIAHNVFEFESGGINHFGTKINGKCLSLQCSPQSMVYLSKPCSENNAKLCKLPPSSPQAPATNWVESMNKCEPVYLFGNVDLGMPSQYCNLSTTDSQVHWIGVARQKYTSEDQGWKIKNEERTTFMQCQRCDKMQCKLKNCHDTLDGTPICKSPELSPIKSTTNSYMYATNEDVSQVISTNRMQDIKVDEDNSSALQISISVVGGLTMLLILAAGMLMYLRKKNNKNNDSGAETPHELTVTKPGKVYQQQDSHFVLDKCSHKMPKESESLAENPYNDSRDGIYDHLRDNTSRKKEVEDTYQHAPAATSEDMSDYDTMANSVKNLEQDSTYDHAHQNINRNSDYGYNLQANGNF